jgi:hypothetical protein
VKRKRIDWAAVRRARERLDELARAHPELVEAGAGVGVADWETIMKKQEKKSETTQTAFRLPRDLLERLDRHVDRVNANSPGLDMNRTDVVRMLLTKGLDEAEREAGRRRK